jgi:hypothetical protein
VTCKKDETYLLSIAVLNSIDGVRVKPVDGSVMVDVTQ